MKIKKLVPIIPIILLSLLVVSCGKVEDPNNFKLNEVNKADVILPIYKTEIVNIKPGETKKVSIVVKNPIAADRKYHFSVEPEQAPEGWLLAVCEGEACYPWGFESDFKPMSKKVFQFQVQVPEKETQGKKLDAYFVFYPVKDPQEKVKVHVEINVK
jgi:hypothetical protein